MRLVPNAEWLNITEVAWRLGCSRSTVLRLVNTGKLRAIRAGYVHRVRRRDLEAFIRSCQVRPHQQVQPELTASPVLESLGEIQLRALRELDSIREQADAIDFPPGFEAWPPPIRKRWLEDLHALYFPPPHPWSLRS